MAFSVVETKIQNPARKVRMGKLSLKQKLFFGSKRQRAAARETLRKKRSSKKSFKPRASKPRTAPKKRNPPKRSAFRAKPRRNPGEIVSLLLGNPGERGKKKMAKTFKKKASGKKRFNRAGRKVTKKGHSKRRRNPAGLGRPMDWVKGGVGVLGGVLVTRGVPQAFLANYNNGVTGYAMNIGTAIAAAWATHAFTKDAVLTASVAAGGFAAVIARLVSDYTSYGQYLSLTGVGDYQFSNFGVPQRLQAPNQALFNGAVDMSAVAPAGAVGSFDTGDMGRRGYHG